MELSHKCVTQEKQVLGRTNSDRKETNASNSSIVLFICIAAVTFLPNRCLATAMYYIIILCIIYRHEELRESFIKYAVEMDLGAMIWVYSYIPGFMKIGSAIQKLVGGWGFTITQEHEGDCISLL
jgi:hypothetical protein